MRNFSGISPSGKAALQPILKYPGKKANAAEWSKTQKILKEIRHHKHLLEIPVVILSTSGDAQTVRETIDLGARHFITKPDLLAAWESVLRQFFVNIEKILKR